MVHNVQYFSSYTSCRSAAALNKNTYKMNADRSGPARNSPFSLLLCCSFPLLLTRDGCMRVHINLSIQLCLVFSSLICLARSQQEVHKRNFTTTRSFIPPVLITLLPSLKTKRTLSDCNLFRLIHFQCMTELLAIVPLSKIHTLF